MTEKTEKMGRLPGFFAQIDRNFFESFRFDRLR
jgi:hypothetical protein